MKVVAMSEMKDNCHATLQALYSPWSVSASFSSLLWFIRFSPGASHSTVAVFTERAHRISPAEHQMADRQTRSKTGVNTGLRNLKSTIVC